MNENAKTLIVLLFKNKMPTQQFTHTISTSGAPILKDAGFHPYMSACVGSNDLSK